MKELGKDLLVGTCIVVPILVGGIILSTAPLWVILAALTVMACLGVGRLWREK